MTRDPSDDFGDPSDDFDDFGDPNVPEEPLRRSVVFRLTAGVS